MGIKYELKFKLKEYPWRIFDTYKDANDPAIADYVKGIKGLDSFEDIKLVKVETIRTDIKL